MAQLNESEQKTQRISTLIFSLKQRYRIKNNKELAQKIGRKQSQLSQLCSGVRPVTLKTAELFKYYFPCVNIDWLLSGTGSMFTDSEVASALGSTDTIARGNEFSPIGEPSSKMQESFSADKPALFYDHVGANEAVGELPFKVDDESRSPKATPQMSRERMIIESMPQSPYENIDLTRIIDLKDAYACIREMSNEIRKLREEINHLNYKIVLQKELSDNYFDRLLQGVKKF